MNIFVVVWRGFRILPALIVAVMAVALLSGPASADRYGAAFPFTKKTVSTPRATIAYVDIGDPDGQPIVFLHGVPTSSYLWRHVLPGVESHGRRLIALDFVGFGDSTGTGYGILDQVGHLESFIEALGLSNIVLVTHDWGAGIGLIWASRHAQKLAAFATMEGALPPVYPRPDVNSFGPMAPLFRRMRDPVTGPISILQENIWIEKILPKSVRLPLDKKEMAAYRRPFPTPESRVPILEMIQSAPIGGQPADVTAALDAAAVWWRETDVPKLFLYARPGRLLPKRLAKWAAANLKNVTIGYVGPGVHFLQETSPRRIARHLDKWLRGLDPPPN